MLEVKQLNVSYGHVKAIHDVSFHVKNGEIFSLIGANGAGKSTLLLAISGVLSPQGGEILYNNHPVQEKNVRYMVNQGVTLVPEGRQIFYDMKVKENLMLGAYRHKKKINILEELEKVYELFPVLKTMESRIAGTLSGGEQQMVAIGRGLMSNPTLLLLDEPSLGLAPLVIKEIFLQLEKLRKTGVTIILVEQNAKAALKISDRAAVLVRGKIEKIDLAENLFQNQNLHEMYVGTAVNK
ncbi:ABC transporter ATP-binding protein [Neobacillus mesonae]|uniref:ABC transporter ATP-binding protein n=1 Tax=Neobacillus mesonae TaxID=1193713 RepID=UPI00203DBDB8|nr:ABC transporter ATP-binding protein [Neobacillus mesonae]MCM3568096.1 ABC transporter ATP-binding protein [Neobacillus mesonae]